MYDREHAWNVLCAHTDSDSLRRHCLGVEAALRWYAQKLGEDEELWATVGVLHDFDYEKHPDEHPMWGVEFLEKEGWPATVVRAVASHADRSGVMRESSLEKHLYAVDELSGFITAVTYVRPSKSILDVEVKSVTKKLKTPAFAAAVNREEVADGAAVIGLTLDEHIANVLAGMRKHAEALGLAG